MLDRKGGFRALINEEKESSTTWESTHSTEDVGAWRCGDGILTSDEACDDGNNASGDDCSYACKVEIGAKCEGSPIVCTATVCGDGVVEGAEGCDDGNTLDGDDCGASCRHLIVI